MSTLLTIDGYQIVVFSNDHAYPMHVHVEKGGCSSKWELTKIVCTYHSRKCTASELRKIRRILREHHEQILEKWHEEFNRR